MNHAEKAVEYYSNNFSCSQGVFTTYATEMGMDEKMALMLATNFGGGERKGELCGAVAGVLMVLGLRCGHYDSNDMESKRKAYGISEEFMNRFIKKNGSVVCRELLGYDLTKEEDMKIIKKIIQTNIRKEQISPKTSSFRGFLYIPINLSDTAKTHEISTVTNT